MPVTNEDIFKLLNDVANSNNEIKEEIKDLKNKSNIEIENLKTKNTELETEIQLLKSKLQTLEKKQKKFNIIIYGLEETTTQVNKEVIRIINVLLKLKCDIGSFRDIHRIGSKDEVKNRPVLIETVNYQLKTDILKSAKSEHKILKEKGIYFSQDYTSKDYEQRKFLYAQFKLAKEKNYDARIKNNILIVNGDEYSYEQLIKNSPLDTENLKNFKQNKEKDEIPHSQTQTEQSQNLSSSTPISPILNFENLDPCETLIVDKKRKLEDTPSKPTGSKSKINTRTAIRKALNK